jgi:uncharacterized membrane protein YebE (DUF533 family)
MFDMRQLLDQVVGAPGGAAARGGDHSQLLKGALGGGLVGLLAGNKKARKFAGKTAGTALKLGGLAAVAAIGYTAWQRHQGQGGADLQMPPQNSAFLPADNAPAQNRLAQGMLVAMIQGAKADGHIDAEEHDRIFRQIDQMGLDAEAKAFVMDELGAPLDTGRIASYADTPETAAELYAAALLAIDPDAPEERRFLTRLQGALNIDEALGQQIEDTVRTEVIG